MLTALQILLGSCSHTRGTVGIVGFRWTAGTHKISTIHKGSPAEGLLKPGDQIVAIDHSKRKTDTRGEPGEPIVFTVKRDGEVFDVVINRIAVQELNQRSLNKYWGVDD